MPSNQRQASYSGQSDCVIFKSAATTKYYKDGVQLCGKRLSVGSPGIWLPPGGNQDVSDRKWSVSHVERRKRTRSR